LRKRIASALAVSARDSARIPQCSREKDIPASFSQERMWLVHQLHPGLIAYNAQVAVHFTGPLDVEALRRSFDDIVQRHELYRTSLAEKDGRIVQRIHEAAPGALRLIDLEARSEELCEATLRRTISGEITKPFRLDQSPLARWALIRLGPQRHTLLCMEHHAITDGWSRYIVLDELMSLYRHHRAGALSAPLSPPSIQFADFAAWQRAWIETKEARGQIDFWASRLRDAPILELPLDRPRPMQPSFRGGHEMMVLDADEIRSLRALAEQAQATLYMLFLAAFVAVLGRHCRTEDVPIGTGIANRRMPETDRLVGMLINTVVLRADLSGDPTFVEWLCRVRAMTVEAYAHQEAPFEKVVEAVAPPRDSRINPLHQVAFNFQNNPMALMDFPELQAELERPLFNGSAKFDLYVAGWPRSRASRGARQADEHEVLLSWEYNVDVFEAATIQMLQDHFRWVLARAVANPQLRLGDLLDGAKSTTTNGGSAIDLKPEPGDRRASTVHRLFEEQAAARPEAVAVECGAHRLSYAELDRRAETLSEHLRACGVRRDLPVGLVARRTIELPIGLLGILKAGGCYVPIDDELPPSRLALMAAKAGLGLIVGPQRALCGIEAAFPGCRLVASDLDEASDPSAPTCEPASSVDDEALAYIVFTSGSTGEPRAVAVPHRAVARLVKGQDFAVMNEKQAWLHHSPLSFDASTLEIWAALCNGGRCVLMPGERASVDEILRVVREARVTSLWLTSAVFRLVAAERADELSGLSQLLTGGDVVPVESARRVRERHPAIRLVNGYGPTENTTFTCCREIVAEDLNRRSIPIGTPIRGTRVWILDNKDRVCPTGIAGELCAGGEGVARGYWRDEAATAQRFVEHPRLGRVYRTGDFCRMLPDGSIEFLGRLDRQIKVRGLRVEPAEVEFALERCEGVAAAAVVARADATGERILVAYVVPSNPGRVSFDSLRRRLQTHLPDGLLPSRFIVVERLPITANGKVNYAALPASAAMNEQGAPAAGFSPPEAVVAAIWGEVLGVAVTRKDDDFFALGGHSLGVLRVLARLRDETGVELPARQFFDAPTVGAVAAAIESAACARSFAVRGESLPSIGGGSAGRAVVFIPGGWGEENEILVFVSLVRRMGTRRPCYAVRSGVLDESVAPPRDIEEQADRIVAAINAKGVSAPPALVGECAASTIALAVAAKLEAIGLPPESLMLLDPGPISHLESLEERLRAARSAEGAASATLPRRVEHYYSLLGQVRRAPISCPIHIILSSRFPDVEAVRTSWTPMAARSLDVHRVAGDHHSYIRESAEETARTLDRILSASRA
jgi:amino acid adenylation domain-containing protein